MRVTRFVVLMTLVACGGDDGGDGDGATLPTVDCTPPVPTFAEVGAFRTNCTMCHSVQLPNDARSGAPVGMDYDVYASAAAVAEDTARTVFQMTMPPSGGLFPADKEVLYRWSLCGAPP
jgi:hypothetical protein